MGGVEEGGDGGGWERRTDSGLGCGEKTDRAYEFDRGRVSGLRERRKCKTFY